MIAARATTRSPKRRTIKRPIVAPVIAVATLITLGGLIVSGVAGPERVLADGRETPGPARTATATSTLTSGAVVSAHPLATAAGRRTLEAGGSAYDAAIAIATTLGVVEPFGSGLAGGGFWLIGDPGLDTPEAVTIALDGEPALRVTFLDARETAPAHITPEALRLRHQALDSALGAGIPGIPAALAWLEQRARLDRRSLLEPAIQAARDGFEVRSRHVQMAAYRANALAQSPDAAAIFLSPADRLANDLTAGTDATAHALPTVGSRLTQPELAETLEALADHGFEAFYRGPLAERLAAGVQAIGGLWTLNDLTGYRLEIRRPLARRIAMGEKTVEVVTAPLPSSGGLVLLELLEVIAATSEASLADPLQASASLFRPRPSQGVWALHADDAERVHRHVEAMRLAYAARAGALGDPDFLSPADRARVDAWLDDDRLAGRQAQVIKAVTERRTGDSATLLADLLASYQDTPSDAGTAGPASGTGESSLNESPQTTHFAVVDREGRFVAATLTLNLPFGSGQVIPGTGLLLNNQLDDFAVAPGQPNAYGLIGFDANAVAPGKRPLSSMTPTFIRIADADWLLGSPGGSRIITTVLHGALAAIEGASVSDVVAAPRFHHQFLPNRIEVEPGAFTPELIEALQGYGHRLRIVPRPWGDLGAVRIDQQTGRASAAGDPRTDADAWP